MEEKKLRSATDNPLVVPVEDDNQTVTQANPHGASVAMASSCRQLSEASGDGLSSTAQPAASAGATLTTACMAAAEG